MKNNNYRSNLSSNALLLIVLAFLAASCKKFVQVDPPPNLLETEKVFTTAETALSAVSGVYAGMRTGAIVPLTAGLAAYCGLYSDELYSTTPDATTEPFFKNELTASTSTITTIYNPFYTTIYKANNIIDGLAHSQLPDSLKSQLTAEMQVVRALCYFYLVNIWNGVPLSITSDYRVTSQLSNATVEAIYAQIISDLKDAKRQLPITYVSAGKARPNKLTASALLARVYLFHRDWMQAESEATGVISSGSYSLVPTASLANVFLKNSTETIWELASTSANETAVVGDATTFVPASATVKPKYALTTYQMSSFEAGDKRNQTTTWVGKNTVATVPYYFLNKYKQKTVATGGTAAEYKILFRVAEQYLIRSEARLQLNNTTGARADVNVIRIRAGLPGTTATDPGSLAIVIAKEWQTEFFGELGFRWLNLKRTGVAEAVLGPIKGATWQRTDLLFPFPSNELLYNPRLVQNPGY